MRHRGRSVIMIVVAATTAVITGACSGGGGSAGNTGGESDSTVGRVPAGDRDATAGTSGPDRKAAALPGVLVGSWSGDDSRGVGSWNVTFTADGRYRMENGTRRVRIDGTAGVNGSTLIMRPDSGQPTRVAWSVDGGRLTLGGSVYLRTDAAGTGARALVGTWLSIVDTYKTLTIAADGTFRLDNPAAGSVAGRWTATASQLTLRAPGRADTTFGWSVRDGFLTLRRPDGTTSEYTRAG